MLGSRQQLEERINEAVGMLDAAKAAAEAAAPDTQTARADAVDAVDAADAAASADADAAQLRARHRELDECKEALVRETASIVKQQRLQAQRGDPRDPWMLRM
eukprot:1063805-Lingulodinium_polyedra.AAC.1